MPRGLSNIAVWTTRHLETRIKEHVPKSVKEYIKDQPKKMGNAASNAIKRSSFSEQLVKNLVCRNSYNKMRFKILRSCTNKFDLVKVEAYVFTWTSQNNANKKNLIIRYLCLVKLFVFYFLVNYVLLVCFILLLFRVFFTNWLIISYVIKKTI